MKELIESTKRLQGDIDKCISNLIHARQYHDKIEEEGAVLDMERLLVASVQQLQCCIDKLEELGNVVEWQTGEPKTHGRYLVQTKEDGFQIAFWSAYVKTWSLYHNSEIIAWCKLSDVKPYKNKEK